MKYFNLVLTLAIVGLLYSCYPKGAEYVDELDTYISKYDPQNFRPDTFAMPDQVIYYKNGELVEDHDHTYDKEILSDFASGLINEGFTPVGDSGDTSLIVSVEAHELTQAGAIYPPGGGWWDPWYPWYPGGGWYPWYPWYPGGGYYPWYPSYYVFQTGTVIFQIGDFDNIKDVNDTTRVPMIYVGAIDGLLQGSDEYILQRVKDGIDQLFKQAPFDKN